MMLKPSSESLFANISGMVAVAIGDLQLLLRSSAVPLKEFGLASYPQKTETTFQLALVSFITFLHSQFSQIVIRVEVTNQGVYLGTAVLR